MGRRLGEHFWSAVDGSPFALERPAIDLGAAWFVIDVVGLRYYEFGRDDGLGGIVAPGPGDRLSLIRRPDNKHDSNAVEVWWRNGIHLGHIPRHDAEWIAAEMDAGKDIRGYVLRPQARAMEAMLLGTAIELRGERSTPKTA